ncbi:MAG: carbohydrate porin [Candidatus Ozemobacteraceae bacterium]
MNYRGGCRFNFFRLLLSLSLIFLTTFPSFGENEKAISPKDEVASSSSTSTPTPTSTSKGDDSQKCPLLHSFNFWQKERENSSLRGQEYSFETSGVYFGSLNDSIGKAKNIYLQEYNLQLTTDLAKAKMAKTGTVCISFCGVVEKDFWKNRSEDSSNGDGYDGLTKTGGGGAFRLNELWYERPFKKLYVLLGIRDMTNDFCTSDFTDALENCGFYFGPEIAANVPLSIFNVPTLGIRLKYDLSKCMTLLAGVFDGYPGDPNENKRGFGLRISPDEGFFNIFEIQTHDPLKMGTLKGDLKFGSWHHTGKFDDLMNTTENGDPITRLHNWGNYFMFTQKISNKNNDPDLGLGFFFRGGGLVPQDRSSIESYFGTGFSYTGLFKGRTKDVLGIGLSQMKTSTALKDFNLANGNPAFTTEKVLEIAYEYQVNDYLILKPDLQIIKNYGGDPTRDTSSIVGIRSTIIF